MVGLRDRATGFTAFLSLVVEETVVSCRVSKLTVYHYLLKPFHGIVPFVSGVQTEIRRVGFRTSGIFNFEGYFPVKVNLFPILRSCSQKID